MDQDRNRRERHSNSGGDNSGNWDDWYGQFDPELTRPIPRSGSTPPPPDDAAPYESPDAPRQPGAQPYRSWDAPPGAGRNPWEPPPPATPRATGPTGSPQRPAAPGSEFGYRESVDYGGLNSRQQAQEPPRPTGQGSGGATPPPTRSGQATTLPRAPRSTRRSGRRRVILGIFGVALVVMCVAVGYFVARIQPVINDVFVPSGRPTQTISLTERRNILLMGLDTRAADDSRSDTLILISVDPKTKSAAMLSVPRDLWVSIPDFDGQHFGEDRINAAYQYGKGTGVENGGPLLVEQTFEQNFGVNVDNFVEVNFAGFRSIVDALDGVTVDVPRPLIDNEYPADYGSAYQRIFIPAGLQHMDGRTALQYVRSRHADSDLGRNQRQQAVLLAIKQQALTINVVPHLNDILQEITGTVKTNLSLEEVIAFGNLARDVQKDNVKSLAVDANMVTETNVNGADVLMPNWDVIRPAVRQLVSDPGVATETAAIVVQNGTDTPGLATTNSKVLTDAGLKVIGVGNPADGGGGRYPTTIIYDFTGGAKPATVAEIRRLLDIQEQNVRPGQAANRPAGTDFLVMIGEDKAK